MAFSVVLLELNARLRQGRHCCAVEQRAASLVLRATLPERQGSGRRQQRIPLHLPASLESLPEAERQAMELGRQLRSGTFAWESWETAPATDPPEIDFRAAARDLHASRYASTPERGSRAWNKKWSPALRKLPTEGPITPETVKAAIEALPAGSAARRDQGSILALVAASVGWDPEPIRRAARGYCAASLHPRAIPSDAQIEDVFRRLKADHWRWAWGCAATYGLRPHELDRLQFTSDHAAVVADESKTGSRLVFACPSRWIEEFRLLELPRPNRRGSNSTSKAMADTLNRAGIPWTMYSVRHAYAIRLMESKVPASVAARLMGHSLQVHEASYKRWLDADRITAIMQRFQL